MANIDDRVVAMSWESTKFQTGVSQTLTSLDKLNAALKKVGVDNGLDNIEKSANKISFFGLGNAIDKLKSKFGRGFPEADQAFSDVEKGSGKVGFTPLTSAIDKLKGQFGNIPAGADQAFSGVERASGRVSFHGLSQAIQGIAGQFSVIEGAAAVALGNLTTKAALAGGNVAKSLTIEPITGGFKEYETQLNAVQTILSNTAASGAKLKDVNAALNELNHYADKTIYNFTEMTKNIGTFTAAGVDLKTATGSIKGIANLAALSGSNSQQAATAMYQLSQAISSGRVSLQDWNSVVNAGMGGTVFQRALAQTAVAMGEIDSSAVKLTGKMKNVTVNGQSFRESIMAKPGEKSWLTGDVLTNTLQQLSGDLSVAELKAQGFSEAQIKAIQKQAKMAVNAATQVKTLSGLLDTTKEAVGSGWAQTWQIIFGDFGEAKTLFTGLATAIGGFVGASANARNAVLKDWKELGGRKVLLDGLKAAFEALKSVVEPIKEAFRDIFPRKTAQQLYDMTVGFRNFMENLKLGPDTMANLRSTFKGFFAVLDIGKQILGGIFTALGRVFAAAGDGSGGILTLSGTVGELLAKLDAWLKEGDRLKNFFRGLGDILAIPIRLISTLTSKLSGIGGGDAGAGVSSSMKGVGDALRPATKAADAASKAWNAFIKVLEKLGDLVGPVVDGIADGLGNIGDAVADALNDNNWDKVGAVIQTGLMGAIFLSIKKALGGGVSVDLGGGVLKNVSESLRVLQGSLVSIQRNVQAHTLLTIASAVGILAASIVVLSLIKPEKLTSAMTAITVSMGQLMAAMAILGKASSMFNVLKVPAMAASLILLAVAIDALALAVLVLSKLSWEELAKGLSGVAGLLLLVSAATVPLSKGGPGMIVAGAGLIAVGVALNILAGAVKIFATMSWEELGKGLAAVAASLVAIGLAMQLMPLTMPLTGAGLILVGIGLNAVAAAVKIFGSMDLGTLAKGVGAIAASLVVIGLAMNAMPPTLPLTAAGLVLVGIALNGIAAAVALFGSMNVGTLAKGLIGLGGALAILAVGLTAMIASLPGAAALLVAAAALAIFVPVLGLLGSMEWGTIVKGLAALALSLGVIAVAGSLAAPGLIALGIGLTALGLGVTAVGAGVYLLGKGIALLATNGSKGVAIFMAALTGLVLLLPKFIKDFLLGLVQVVAGIAKLAPQIVSSVAIIITSMLNAVILSSPKFAQATTALITAMLQVLARNAGPMIRAGWDLLLQLLRGISNNIGRVTRTVADIIVRFLNALASKMPQLTAAGANLLSRFLAGIANNLSKVVSAAFKVVTRYIDAIGDNLGKVVTAGAKLIIKLIDGVSNNMGKVATAGVNAVIRFLTGIENNLEKVVRKGVQLATKFINAVADQTVKLASEGAKAVIRFLNGVADAIEKYEPQLIQAGARIGVAIAKGIIKGLGSMAGQVAQKAKSMAGDAVKGIGKALHIGSPSKITTQMGVWVGEGLANGLSDGAPLAKTAAANLSNGVLRTFRDIFQIQSPSKTMHDLGQYVGQGFAEGLLGTTDQIENVWTDLNNKLTDFMTTTRQTISTEQDKLDRLRKAKKPDKGEIKETRELINKNKELLNEATQAHEAMKNSLKDERASLVKQAADYQKVAEQLDEAQRALEDAVKAREDFVGQNRDKYATLPDIIKTDADGNPVDQLGTYLASLDAQKNAVASYKATLAQLRALGLDDATYKKLLEEGTGAQQFAQQLLDAGPDAVRALNLMDAQLNAEATQLGYNAAQELYQAGVDAAQGVVNGLKSKQSAIRKEMERIATIMLTAIKKKLKMKSPSREFMNVGRLSTEGLVVGLKGSSRAVTDAASSIGDDAITAMRDSMSHISDAIDGEIESNPTITPVLDLSQVKKDAKQLNGMTTPFSADASYGLAASVDTSQATSDGDSLSEGGPTFKFEQNNYSPKALSETEVYRQTNNQLSQAKSALGLQ